MSEASRIRDFYIKGSTEQVSLVTRGLALRALSGMVMRTPVDTGRARGNWQVSIGVPVEHETGRFDASGGGTISEGNAAIGSQRGYQVIVIQNNVPYIERLNDGWSKQAPNPGDIVEATLAGLGMGTGRD